METFTIRDDIDLDFSKENTFYATHRMHSFGAKFPPQLAAWAIAEFSLEGDTVLDPMCGSGTTLVEAVRFNRTAFGSDIDPLARLISKVKSTPLDPLVLSSKMASFEVRLRDAFEKLNAARLSNSLSIFMENENIAIPDFPNRDYWYLPEIQEELALLVAQIAKEDDQDFADFLFVVFSAIIITKGKTSVANVMDLAHSRPHFRQPTVKPNVLELYADKLHKLGKDLVNFSVKYFNREGRSIVVGTDARSLPIKDNSVDLIFTSPPYVNAIDYQRAHKFSLFWLSNYIGISHEEYVELGKDYIGSERVPRSECLERQGRSFSVDLVDNVLNRLSQIDVKSFGIAHRYFENMERVIAEGCRVLALGHVLGIVVSPSQIKGLHVPTHEMLAAIGTATRIMAANAMYGFVVQDIHRRVIDDSKRQLPYMRGQFGPGMRDEFVIILRKVEKSGG